MTDGCDDDACDRGETLVEVLVAVVILGVAGVAIMAGVFLTVRSSDMHRKETAAGAFLRSYAERIQEYSDSMGYTACPAAGAYSYSAVSSAIANDLVLPAGFNAPTYTVTSVNQALASVACSSDIGLQKIKLVMSSKDGRTNEALTFVLRNSCRPDQAVCA